MPDRSLELGLNELEAEVGDFAGFGRGNNFGEEAWSADQQRQITSSVDSGCRMVYFTEEMDGIPGSYPWSFLQPRSTIALTEGEQTLELPPDFAGLLGDVIPASTAGAAEYRIAIVPYDSLFAARAMNSTMTGRPYMACVTPAKGTTADRGTRWQLELYPINDADRTLQVWYTINPTALTEQKPHPHGGAAMSETFKAAVRAAYEIDFDGEKQGVEAARFYNRLRAAIAADRRNKAMRVGYNGDASDDPYTARPGLHGEWGVPLEVNGVTIL